MLLVKTLSEMVPACDTSKACHFQAVFLESTNVNFIPGTIGLLSVVWWSKWRYSDRTAAGVMEDMSHFGTHHIRAEVATANGARCVAHKGRTGNRDIAAQLLDSAAVVCGLHRT